MFFQHRAFCLPKDVEHPDQNQDAFAVDGVRGVAAIADGASSSLFAAPWAQLLARAAVEQTPQVDDPIAMGNWLTDSRTKWRAPIDVEQLAWHQKPKFEAGAFATLLWVELQSQDASGCFPFQCYSIGDCCVFHVREQQVLRAFPFEHSRLFDTTPKMLGSVAKDDAQLEFDTLSDVGQPDDLLVLCTDALAVWYLQRLESGSSPPWESMWDMTDNQWSQFVLDLRAKEQIRYDDTTALLLRLGDSPDESRRSGAKRTSLIDEVKKGVSDIVASATKSPLL